MNARARFFRVSCLIFGFVATWAMEAFALERGLDFELSVQEEYNDNIFYAVDDEIEDYITTLTGDIMFHNYTERSSADLSARVEGVFYQDRDELDATDQFYKGDASFVLTPRWQGGLNAAFNRDSRADRELETTGLVLLGTAERDQTKGGVFTKYKATENTDATLSYSYGDETYDEDAFPDMISHQAGFALNHNWSKVFDDTSLQFYGNYGRYEYDYDRYDYDKVNINLYSCYLGFTKKTSELWALSMSGGTRYQETEFENLSLTETNDDKWGVVWKIGLDYKGEYGRFGLSGNHDVTPSSGLSGTTERTSLGLELDYRLWQKSGVGLNIYCHLNTAGAGQSANEDKDNETWQISPHLKLYLLDELYLFVKYIYSHVEDRIAETTSSRQLGILKLAYNVNLWD